jgi:anaerobic selenocysteine-containing dehydrogenase
MGKIENIAINGVVNGVVKGACPHDCPDACALKVTVTQGVVTKVEGDPNHPPTDGVLCTKVSRYAQRTHHKDRLLQPLKRVGPKGPNQGPAQFEPVSWEEALTDIAAKLTAIAAQNSLSILPYSYAGTMGFVQGEGMASRFFNRLGASALDRTICASAGAAGLKYTLGASVGMDAIQFQDAKLILLWGTNPVTSSVHLWTRVQEAKRRGAKVIAIDPFASDSAQKCHEHIALMPGTDAALALGMMHVLIQDNLIDKNYIEQYTLGFEALKVRAMAYTPARVAKICQISESQIIQLARDYGSTQSSAIRLNYGMQRSSGGGNAVRAILSLPALTGAWRHSAGGALLSSSGWFPVQTAKLEGHHLHPLPVSQQRTINMTAIGDALLSADPPIKALIVYNSNPVAIAPDSEKVIQGFARDDLFTVVLEHFQTDTADYADYILPATTQLEHFDVQKSYGHFYLMCNQPAIAPLGQCKPNSEIFRLLAKQMGFKDAAFELTDQELARVAVDWQHPSLAHSNYDTLLQDGWVRLQVEHGLADKTQAVFANGGFPTPSGKCEFFSQRLLDQGLDPLPDYIEPHDPPTPAFPLRMISPPTRHFMNTTFVNVESLRQSEPEPIVYLHPIDAKARGIAAGAMVRMNNERGACLLRAQISDRTRIGLAVVPSIWWHKLSEGGKNVNALTSQRLTDLGGGATFYDCAVQVSLH